MYQLPSLYLSGKTIWSYKYKHTGNIDCPKKSGPLCIWPELFKRSWDEVESYGDDDEQSEALEVMLACYTAKVHSNGYLTKSCTQTPTFMIKKAFLRVWGLSLVTWMPPIIWIKKARTSHPTNTGARDVLVVYQERTLVTTYSSISALPRVSWYSDTSSGWHEGPLVPVRLLATCVPYQSFNWPWPCNTKLLGQLERGIPWGTVWWMVLPTVSRASEQHIGTYPSRSVA